MQKRVFIVHGWDGYPDSKIIIEYNMKHFSGSTGTLELPSALDALLEITK